MMPEYLIASVTNIQYKAVPDFFSSLPYTFIKEITLTI